MVVFGYPGYGVHGVLLGGYGMGILEGRRSVFVGSCGVLWEVKARGRRVERWSVEELEGWFWERCHGGN